MDHLKIKGKGIREGTLLFMQVFNLQGKSLFKETNYSPL